jgi:HEAT repeat protein
MVLSAVVTDLDQGAATLRQLRWTEWRRFDAELRARTITAPDWIPGWWGISPAAVVPYCAASKDPVLTAALLSMHPSGYVRERAVGQLVSAAMPDSIPALILRSTDWVGPVREVATAGLLRLRASLGPAALLPALSLLEPPRWSARARGNALDETRAWLLSNLTTGELVAALRYPDPKVRQAAARGIVGRDAAGVAFFAALEQSDPATATIVANGMSPTDWSRPDAIGLALGSKFSQVASTALAWLQASDPHRAVEASITALMTRSPTTRFLAQHFLKKQGVDARSVYRSALQSQPEIALAGLGEIGEPADAQLIAPYLQARLPAQRASAATALGRLAGRAAEERLCDMLADSSPRVARAASWALIRLGPSSATIERAWQTTIDHQAAGTRNATFRLFGSSGRWTALRLAFRGVGADDADLDERCRALLANCMRSWNRSFTSPPAGERAELEAVVPGAVQHLDPATGEIVLLSVKPYLEMPVSTRDVPDGAESRP